MSNSFRIGHGYDIHRLQDGGKLVVGGIVVAEGISPVAHSDGDVVAHAVVDALLGAMALGDIGEHFPNSDPQWKGVSSRVFLVRTLEQLVNAGFRPHNLDITIMAERPRLKAFKREMAAWLAEVLEMPVFRVNVKAGTNEGCDAIGRGEAIAAHAVVLVEAIT
jgi:2-C-methyl-D-erythritol 2,4-cyclodiphosphate synthase